MKPRHDKSDLLRLPTAEELMQDASASDWLKNALQSSVARDPVDATNDAEILVAVLNERLRSLLESRDANKH